MRTRNFFTVMFLILALSVAAQNDKNSGIPLIGSDAPAFTAETTTGKLNFPCDFGKNWKILFSHPRDFTPVCTTELMELARLQEKFQALNVKLAVISTDTKERHLLWKSSMEEMLSVEKLQPKITFPLIDDSNAKVSRLYGMLHAPASTSRDVRGVFVINPSNKVEAIYFYPSNTGRNMDEMLRTVEALQTAHATNLMTPVNWKPGGDLLVPHFPYTQDELAKNPVIENDYYKVGNSLWFKKGAKE
jgi:peroxiredoxin (alkyl hydroperoxide reductase subunit C)